MDVLPALLALVLVFPDHDAVEDAGIGLPRQEELVGDHAHCVDIECRRGGEGAAGIDFRRPEFRHIGRDDVFADLRDQVQVADPHRQAGIILGDVDALVRQRIVGVAGAVQRCQPLEDVAADLNGALVSYHFRFIEILVQRFRRPLLDDVEIVVFRRRRDEVLDLDEAPRRQRFGLVDGGPDPLETSLVQFQRHIGRDDEDRMVHPLVLGRIDDELVLIDRLADRVAGDQITSHARVPLHSLHS